MKERRRFMRPGMEGKMGADTGKIIEAEKIGYVYQLSLIHI